MCNRTVVDVQQKSIRGVHYNASSRAAERWYTCVRILVGVAAERWYTCVRILVGVQQSGGTHVLEY